jgi:hypothetical protein
MFFLQKKIPRSIKEIDMKDIFRKLHEEKTPPPEAKRAILDEIHTYQMLSDIVTLFTGDFVRAELDMLSIPEAAQKKENKNR